MEKTYHLGLIKGTGNTQYWSNNHHASTVVLQARQSIDYLSCELWHYLGERITTKQQLKSKKSEILTWINKEFNCNFRRLIID